MLTSMPGEGRWHFAEMKGGQRAGAHSRAQKVGAFQALGGGPLFAAGDAQAETTSWAGVGAALGKGGTVGLEDGSLWPSCSWGPASCVWHFPVLFLQPQEGLFTTSQSQERSSEFLPSNLAALALQQEGPCLSPPCGWDSQSTWFGPEPGCVGSWLVSGSVGPWLQSRWAPPWQPQETTHSPDVHPWVLLKGAKG